MRSEVDRIVSSFAHKLLAVLDDLIPKSPNEATLRHRVEPILSEFCVKVGVDPEVRDEYVVAQGKIADAVFDRLVVEFKRPGVLSQTGTRGEAGPPKSAAGSMRRSCGSAIPTPGSTSSGSSRSSASEPRSSAISHARTEVER